MGRGAVARRRGPAADRREGAGQRTVRRRRGLGAAVAAMRGSGLSQLLRRLAAQPGKRAPDARVPRRDERGPAARPAYLVLGADPGRDGCRCSRAARGSRWSASTGLGGTKISMLPLVNALGDRRRGHRAGPARLRRVGEAARQPLRRQGIRVRRARRCSTRSASRRSICSDTASVAASPSRSRCRDPGPRRKADPHDPRDGMAAPPGLAVARQAGALAARGDAADAAQADRARSAQGAGASAGRPRRSRPFVWRSASSSAATEARRARRLLLGGPQHRARRSARRRGPLDAAVRRCRRRRCSSGGRRDPLVPIGFERHVQERLPAATHLELSCGHLPQVERPRELVAGIRDFLQLD